MCSFRKQPIGQHFLSLMQQQLHPCPWLYLTSSCPPDQPAARAHLISMYLFIPLPLLSFSTAYVYLSTPWLLLLKRQTELLQTPASEEDPACCLSCLLPAECSGLPQPFPALHSGTPFSYLILWLGEPRVLTLPSLSEDWEYFIVRKNAAAWTCGEGEGSSPDNPLRIINISSLNTFLRITFVLLRPVAADRALLIASVSPPFSGLCWERSLSGTELAILRQAIVSVQGKN